MASFRKIGKSWKAEVVKGGRRSKSFPTKQMAVAWAAEVEAEALAGKTGSIPNKTFGDALQRYGEEVSAGKKGEQWELVRLKMFGTMPIATIALRELSSSHFATWRDQRLKGTPERKAIAGESVRREMNLLSHVCTIAIDEWKWLKEHPIKGLRRPPPGKRRKRRVLESEIEALCFVSGYKPELPELTDTAQVIALFLFCIETGMRQGEVLKMDPKKDVRGSVVHVPESKNGEARDVAMSARALEILKQVGRFTLSSASADALFRKMTKRAAIEGLTFHDSRHEAITRLSKKLDVLELARQVGHRNLSELLTYYEADAQAMADKLR